MNSRDTLPETFDQLWAKHADAFQNRGLRINGSSSGSDAVASACKDAMRVGFESRCVQPMLQNWETYWIRYNPKSDAKPALFVPVVTKSVSHQLTVDWLEPIFYSLPHGETTFCEEYGHVLYWMPLHTFNELAPSVLREHLHRPDAESLAILEERKQRHPRDAEEVAEEEYIEQLAAQMELPPVSFVPVEQNKSGRTIRCRHGVAVLNHCNECD